MAIGLSDIYKKLDELVTVMDKVRENTEGIKDIRMNQEEMQANVLKLMEGQKHILERLEYKEEFSSLKVKLAEHIAACEKTKA